MARVPVIDNGSQWTHRIYRTLRDLDVDTLILPNTTPCEKLSDCDGLVFSGGALRIGLGDVQDAGFCGGYLDQLNVPILGICAGQQFIALHFGGEVAPAAKPEYGRVELRVEQAGDLFSELPTRFMVWASHNDEVRSAPGFKVLASSKDVRIHAFQHESKPFFGTLFHPEVAHTEHGDKIFSNFVKVCKR